MGVIFAAGGLLLLSWGAERFIYGAAALARRLGVSTLVIGLTIVALGTSAPEFWVNLTAQLRTVPAMAFGNVVGSNIANIGLVLGLSAVFFPIAVSSRILKREYPLLIGMTLVLGVMGLDGVLEPLEGGLLALALSGYLYWALTTAKEDELDPFLTETVAEVPPPLGASRATGWLVLGLITLILGSWGLVDGATHLASTFGVSDFVIGLSVVAVGTSLPEVATSLAAVFKREHDLIVGNVVGSCLFNILFVLGIPTLLGALPIGSEALWRDLPVAFGLTLLLGPLFWNREEGGYQINRIEGGVLVIGYGGYITWLYCSAMG